MAQDEQDQAEALDEDRLDGPYPPDQPMAVGEYGLTGREDEIDEPLEERVAREQPEVRPGDDAPDAGLVDPAPVGDADREGTMIAEQEARPEQTGPLEEGDPVAGDPTTRDVAPERSAGESAEEAALHVDES